MLLERRSMNYERFKKVIVSLALMCVFAFSALTTGAFSAFAQEHRRGYDRRDYYRSERRYDHDYWRRRAYHYPGRYHYYGYPYQHRYHGNYPGYYDRYGRFHRTYY